MRQAGLRASDSPAHRIDSTGSRHRVWFINRYFHPDSSATSQILSQLAAHLAEQGWPCGILTSRQLYEAPHADLPREEHWQGVRIHRMRTTRFGRAGLAGRALDYLSFNLAAVWNVFRLVKRGDIMVAMTDPPMLGLVLILPCWLKGGRPINWLQDIFPEIACRLSRSKALSAVLGGLRPLRDFGLRRAAANIVVGRCMRSHLARRGIAAEIICNWADEDVIRPLAHAHNPRRQAWGLGSAFVVGYSGNFGRVHVFDTIVAAAAQLADLDDLIFLMIGGGKQLQQVREEAQNSGLSRWQFHPYQPAEVLSQTLGAADVHLVTQHPGLSGVMVPSKWYGVAAAARPAIYVGPSDAEIALVIAEERCGWQIEPGDASGLAELIRWCRDHPEECRQRGVRAGQAFEQRFRRARSFAAWQQLLTQQAARAGWQQTATEP